MAVTTSADRFLRRRAALHEAAAMPGLVLLPSAANATELLAAPLDTAFIDAPYAAERCAYRDVDGSGDVDELLASLAHAYDDRRFDDMLGDIRKSVVSTVANAFGVGKLVSAYDRTGGNVDTVHNVHQNIYASDAERQRYEERGEYDTDACHSHDSYKTANAAMGDALKDSTLVDTYTGKSISPADKKDDQLKPSLDHVVAAKNVHDDRRRVLAGLETEDLSNIPANLAPTTKTVNSTKGTRDAARLEQLLARNAAKRRAQLEELKSRRDSWTDKDRKRFNRLQAQENIDIERVNEKERAAKEAIKAETEKAYYKSGKFARATLTAGAKEGAKMGVQQALGVVVVEFLTASMDEIRHLYQKGRSEETLVKEASVRLKRIALRIAAQWKHAFTAMRDGFVAGLLGSLVTTLLNTFVTTGARVVRMIREGFGSLVRAVKLLIMRPQGMTRRQALHEASKVIVGTVALVGGIALEEVLSKWLAPVLFAAAEPAAAVLAGALTAICTGFAVYLVDKADILNVNAEARARAVGVALDERIAASLEALRVEYGIPVAAAAG
jgi:hypothetical protein